MVLRYSEGAETFRSSATAFLFPEDKPALRAVK